MDCSIQKPGLPCVAMPGFPFCCKMAAAAKAAKAGRNFCDSERHNCSAAGKTGGTNGIKQGGQMPPAVSLAVSN